ncbi:MAG: SpoIIE family protein phosphatase [Candidatus Eiseniibacteriota bacterium]|jgi:sigma-B regulation protein RsbU (phosphoserine phosphatase)
MAIETGPDGTGPAASSAGGAWERADATTLRALVALLRQLNSAPDPWTQLERVVALAARVLGAGRGSICVVRGRPSYLEPRVVRGRAVAEGRRLLPGDGGVTGWVALHDAPLVLEDPAGDARYDPLPPVDADGPPPPRNLAAVPLRNELGLEGVLELEDREGGFGTAELELFVAIAEEIAVWLRKARLVRELGRQRLLSDLLFDINKTLVSSLELDAVLGRIVDALGRVLEFDAAGIFLVTHEGSVEHVVARGYDVSRMDLLHQKVGAGLVGWAIAAGEAIAAGDVSRDRRYINARDATRSELVAPMISKGRVIGAFNIESDLSDAFSSHDLERLRAFADQATAAVEIARLHARALEARRLEEELSIAREIQAGLMPATMPEVPGIDLAGHNVPSEAVGGDYYDVIDVAPGQLGVVIGDVSGKGVPAGLIMASFRAALLAEIRNNYSIATIFRKVNRLLFESIEPDRFVTAFYGVIDLHSLRFTYACAGHNPAIIVRADGGVEQLEVGGTVLGAFAHSAYEEGVCQLARGDLLVLYTDGVTETVDHAECEFGADTLIDLVRTCRHEPAATVAASIERAVQRHASGRAVRDDLTLLVLKVGSGNAGSSG